MRGSISLRRMALRVYDDVPRGFLPPPREAHSPANFLVRRWETSEIYFLPLFRLVI